ncbi:hypothetical protein ACOSZF_12415 [Cytobacillus firmus]|jgi:hypothetical protein|uniref:hypothetical protein n=1 Tax=Cytobacillus firmus TaxID=1399 RepID=UPI00077CC6B8|nr:hypothetical protein [Cytobacillus firmus]MBG9544677.1 hypothetical protein [Cytobacillus firmus]MBG9547969.1 hypothetical protein [Cytobacillus firmus]MBG9554044.1 hypothetical protein [Cytobacillus firmus]MBG9558425.1 hypothetical protein [Cytobacillus firmus]MBG9577033.1 hypothetical protein [Cytobacillus firmus]
MDLDMKIQPKFIENESAIIFSFYFRNASMKVGEAVIYTCEEEQNEELTRMIYNSHEEITELNANAKRKMAYVTELTIPEGFKNQSFTKIKEFLKIIGINTCVYQH